MERIGLYGGTFAPPHLGHVHAAKVFLATVSLDRLLIMPAGIPPHKTKTAGDTPEERLAMCRAAFGNLPHTEISDYEIRKPGKSYTVETLEALAAPEREITMLCARHFPAVYRRLYGKRQRRGRAHPHDGRTVPQRLWCRNRTVARRTAGAVLLRNSRGSAFRHGYARVSAVGRVGNL